MSDARLFDPKTMITRCRHCAATRAALCAHDRDTRDTPTRERPRLTMGRRLHRGRSMNTTDGNEERGWVQLPDEEHRFTEEEAKELAAEWFGTQALSGPPHPGTPQEN